MYDEWHIGRKLPLLDLVELPVLVCQFAQLVSVLFAERPYVG
jgi:hypothetical protein